MEDKPPAKSHGPVIAVIAVVAILALGLGSYAAVAHQRETMVEPSAAAGGPRPVLVPGDLNSDGVVSSEEYDQMDPEQYRLLDAQDRVDDSAANFTRYLHTAWETIQPYLTAEDRDVLYMPDLSKPSAQWSDQDYLNYESLAIWLVTSQGTSQDALDEALRATSAFTSPTSNMNKFVSKHITDYPGQGLKDLYKAQPNRLSDRELYNIDVGGYGIGSAGGRLVGYVSLTDGSENNKLFVNMRDNVGNTIPVAVFAFDSLNQPELSGVVDRYGR